MHWLTGLTYLYCLATGLAFYSPHLFWIAYMLGGAPTSRFWHPIVGIGFVIGTLWMHGMWRPRHGDHRGRQALARSHARPTSPIDDEHTRSPIASTPDKSCFIG